MAASNLIKGHARFHDDFSGPVISATNGLIASKCKYTLGTGTNTVTRLAINGGAVRMLGDTNEAADMALYGPLQYEPDECGLMVMQARVRMNTNIGKAALFVGFTDADDDAITVSYEDAAVVSTPTDAFGVVYEGEQSTLFYTLGVGNDVDDTIRVTDNIDAPAVATWHTIKIEADNNNDPTTGVIRYRVRIDGVVMTTAATNPTGWTTSKARSSIVYCPVIGRMGRATAYSIDVAELYADGGLGVSFD